MAIIAITVAIKAIIAVIAIAIAIITASHLVTIGRGGGQLREAAPSHGATCGRRRSPSCAARRRPFCCYVVCVLFMYVCCINVCCLLFIIHVCYV